VERGDSERRRFAGPTARSLRGRTRGSRGFPNSRVLWCSFEERSGTTRRDRAPKRTELGKPQARYVLPRRLLAGHGADYLIFELYALGQRFTEVGKVRIQKIEDVTVAVQ
jgi:hypothetical protein